MSEGWCCKSHFAEGVKNSEGRRFAAHAGKPQSLRASTVVSIVLLVLAESVIQSAGHETLSASTTSQAQALIEADNHFDLVVTDIALGEDQEGGIHVGEFVRQHRRKTPVLYTSGFDLTDGLKELFVDKSGFLPKPYTDHQLIEAMNALLQNK